MIYSRTGDVRATAELPCTARIPTDRYTLGGVAPRLRCAVKGFKGGSQAADGWQYRLAV
jgi:hypothetical protein